MSPTLSLQETLAGRQLSISARETRATSLYTSHAAPQRNRNLHYVQRSDDGAPMMSAVASSPAF